MKASRAPVDARQVWIAVSCWLVGEWPVDEVRRAYTDERRVAVIGRCGAPAGELAQLATDGVPDDVTWRWPGSYVVVQVTATDTKLWTDLGGAWPLYTLAGDGGTYWASSSRALAALTGHRLDLPRLATSLLAPGVPALADERSAFADISLVPAGHRAVLPAAGPVEIRRVWHPQPCAGDHAMRLRRELAAAVAIRVDAAAAPTVDLSGGYDSTSLALLAAEQLSPERTVIAVTVHPDGVTTGGDLSYARQAAAHHPGIVHQLMPLAAEHLPYTALAAVPVTDEPAPSTIAHARFSAQLHWMRHRFGSDCHLTGDGGDALLMTPPIMLAELIAHRRYRRALGEATAWARLRRISVWPLLVAAIRTARTSRLAALQALSRSLRTDVPNQILRIRNGGTGWFPPPLPAPSWATRQARELTVPLDTAIATHEAYAPLDSSIAAVIAEVMAEVGRTARADIQLAEWHGIALHNPFTDSRVIDTYLAVPLDARPGPAEFKPILRRAMSDLFPPALARRITKGTFTSDYYGGIRANLPTLLAMADGQLAAAGLVNPPKLRQTLILAATGLPAAFATVEPVVAAEVWLRSLDAAQPVLWEPALSSRGTDREGGAA